MKFSSYYFFHWMQIKTSYWESTLRTGKKKKKNWYFGVKRITIFLLHESLTEFLLMQNTMVAIWHGSKNCFFQKCFLCNFSKCHPFVRLPLHPPPTPLLHTLNFFSKMFSSSFILTPVSFDVSHELLSSETSINRFLRMWYPCVQSGHWEIIFSKADVCLLGIFILKAFVQCNKIHFLFEKHLILNEFSFFFYSLQNYQFSDYVFELEMHGKEWSEIFYSVEHLFFL